ncbi:hypothetical protein GSY74_00380 [Sulfurovum sp. bin170]|nr:hypothetical protein [Sulfurovum sp. bin170]
MRAEFISKKGLGEFSEVYQNFKDRDSTLKSFRKYDKIFLWFEHDLYDQLQLIQLLDWFAKYASTDTQISIISPENYLEKSTPKELREFLLYNRELVTHRHFITARKAWSAFSSKTPQVIYKLLNDDIEALPFLKDAVKRILEEYPNSINGLSRTAHQALLIISDGKQKPQDIFEEYQNSEERLFMGDVLFWDILKRLVEANLLNSMENGRDLKLTSLGVEVLQGKKNLFELHKVDRWIGGVHLTPDNLWCWDIETEQILKYNFSTNKNAIST